MGNVSASRQEASSDVSRNTSIYKMTVDLNVLEYLGVSLYSNIAAVLTEVVANAWDADAKEVSIEIDKSTKQIKIIDDGIGMSIKDMNAKYLRVGYKRRGEDGVHGSMAKTEMGRPIMGRKGLGKLSLFSIAEEIEIQSAKGGDRHGLLMTTDGIKQAASKEASYYYPQQLGEECISVNRGTQISLRKVNRQRLGKGIAALRKHLARRFSVISERYDFKVAVNGDPISVTDRDDLLKAQFLWTFGPSELEDGSTPDMLEHKELPNKIPDEDDWYVKGWLGTVEYPKQLDNKESGNLNSIVVLSRGRIFQENILDKVNDGRFYTKYLTGQVEANFLDFDYKPDIATSDRQRIQEDDPRYVALLSFLKTSLDQVADSWGEWRRKHEVRKAKKDSPALNEWLASLPRAQMERAETLIAKLSALPVDKEDDRKLLYRYGILAFERMRLRESTDQFVSGIQDTNELLKLLAGRDALEASLYCDITKSRLDAIKSFRGLIDENAKEKVLQKYLFNHLWLLDPAWERATGSELMESRLSKAGVIVKSMDAKERLKRVDIVYRTNAGKHILVELKRAGASVTLNEIRKQGDEYVDKLKKILMAQEESRPNIEIVFVLGKPVREEQDNPDRVKHSMLAISPGSRIVHYDSLIANALKAYSEYLEKSKEFDRIEKIVDQINTNT